MPGSFTRPRSSRHCSAVGLEEASWLTIRRTRSAIGPASLHIRGSEVPSALRRSTQDVSSSSHPSSTPVTVSISAPSSSASISASTSAASTPASSCGEAPFAAAGFASPVLPSWLWTCFRGRLALPFHAFALSRAASTACHVAKIVMPAENTSTSLPSYPPSAPSSGALYKEPTALSSSGANPSGAVIPKMRL